MENRKQENTEQNGKRANKVKGNEVRKTNMGNDLYRNARQDEAT